MMPTRLPEILRNYTNNGEGSAVYKSLHNFYVNLVTHYKNIMIIRLTVLPTLLPTYLSGLKTKNLKYPSCSWKTEDFWKFTIWHY